MMYVEVKPYKHAIRRLKECEITQIEPILAFLSAVMDEHLLRSVAGVYGDEEIKRIALILVSKTQAIHDH